MNAEIYLVRDIADKKRADYISGIVPSIAHQLKKQNVNIVYKTEVGQERLRIIQAVQQSISASENINMVIIPDVAASRLEEKVLYRTICSLTANSNTKENEVLNELRSESLPNLIMAQDFYESENIKKAKAEVVRANGIKLNDIGTEASGYCFFLNGKKIVLIPKTEKADIKNAILMAVDKSLLLQPLSEKEIEINGLEFTEDTSDIELPESEKLSKKKNKPEKPAKIEEVEKLDVHTEVAEEFNLLPLNLNKDIDLVGIDDDIVIGGEKKVSKTKREKGRFKRAFIPMRGDSGAEVVRKIIFDIALITLLVTAGILLWNLVINPWLNQRKVDVITDKPGAVFEIKDPITGEVKGQTSHNWAKIQKENKEIVAWVKINNTKINYPVLEHKGDNKDSQYYLYRNYLGEQSSFGSVFIDYRSKESVNSKNVIIHGHHMNDGSMFQNLMKYGTMEGDLDFYKKSPTIQFDTPAGDATYKIIAVYKTNTEEVHGTYFDYLTGTFTSDAEFMNYVYLVRARSFFNTPVAVNEKDQLLTLSTCSYEYGEFRTVVVARKVRDGEDLKVDVSKAKLNPNPLWPQVYYSYSSAVKPKITSFSKAFKAGEITWYDGKGKLKGKERAFTLYDEDPVEPPTSAEEVVANEPQTDPPEESQPEEAAPVLDNAIYFNYATLEMNIGGTEILTIDWEPADTSDKWIQWSSSNANVAGIAQGGVVTARGSGTATITATTRRGNTASCEVTVHVPIQSAFLSETNHTMNVGETHQLVVTVNPSNADNQGVVWSTSNIAAATVDQNGVVTARGTGSATITARVEGLSPLQCVYTINEVQQPQQEADEQ
ncbi:hypothetical protein AGMMS50284_2110 [Clostridia bacterium]|nr:hypothetical protein AGMMS50284_2110 [Clostridia bacterium]